MATVQVEGPDGLMTVTEGDFVCFKSDFEQSGQIQEIKNNGRTLVLVDENGFGGEYLRYATITEESTSDCWAE